MTEAPSETDSALRLERRRVAHLLRQQKALSEFGSFALGESSLTAVLERAAQVCAEGLGAPFSKICRYRVAENDLLIEAGFGWKAGVIGHAVSLADVTSPQGRAFSTGKPSICNDLRADTEFALPAFYGSHGVVSTIDVVIRGKDRPYGVLEVDNNEPQTYDDHDIDFLNGFANVLGEAVGTQERAEIIRQSVQSMSAMLEQKLMLGQELQHRVRNSLHLVHGMLSRQIEEGESATNLKAIARRVSTLAQVYDHLLGSGMARTTDFAAFASALCDGLRDVYLKPDSGVTLTCTIDPLLLDLDVVTALGLIVAELVTNSYEHAFPDGRGTITVSLARGLPPDAMASLLVTDSGIGFEGSAPSKRHGLGLIRRLSEQVGGTVTLDTSSGTVWKVRFPIGAE